MSTTTTTGAQSPAVHDIALVGFGPVGQTLALLLGRAGHDVLVLERWPHSYDLPRAVHFDHEIARIFQAAGVSEEVSAVTDPVPDFYEWRNAAGEALVRIDWSGTGPSGWPTANFFSQPALEGVLTRAAEALPNVTVRRGRKVVALEEHGPAAGGDGYVTLTSEVHGGGAESERARYVVGADGANSFVREHMDATVTDLGFFFDWLIVDVLPHDREEVWSPMNWQLCDPARPTTVVSGGPGRRRWEFMRLPGETKEQLGTQEAAWELLRPWGRTPGNTTIERHAVYTFQARWVDRWRAGRLLLAGDAAHQMPPFAGQGMCSGLRDAANLSWKLDLVLRGLSGPGVLDSYTSERSAHIQHAISMSMALGQVICVLDPAEAAARDARMTAAGAHPATALPPMPPEVLGDGILQRGPDGRRADSVGHLAPQCRMTLDGRTALLDELTGGGFALLTDGSDPLSELGPEEVGFFRSLGGTIVRTYAGRAPKGGYVDVDDALLPHLREHTHVAALVRPDFYLYGTARDASGVRDLLRGLRAQLSGEHTGPGREAAPVALTTSA